MPTITGTFPVTDASDIRLQVWIGDAQLGESSAAIAGQEVASGDPINTSLGAGGALRGKSLVVASLVKDIRSETDWTSVTVRLISGDATREFHQRQQVKSGEIENYVFVITFGASEEV